jgi:hypothetical protein
MGSALIVVMVVTLGIAAFGATLVKLLHKSDET